MNADFLLTYWNHLTTAPDAIAAFRRVILDLAVRGQLTTDWRAANPKTEPASELLKRIKKEKTKLIAAKKLRAEKPLPETNADETPFEVPPGWLWCRLFDLCEKTGSGSTPSGGKSAYTEAGIPFLRSQNVHDHGLELSDVALISEAIHESMSGTKVRPNDLLLNITGGSIGRCSIVPPEVVEANVSQHVAIIRPVEPKLSRYLHIEIRSAVFKTQTDGAQTGAGREGLPKNKMDLFPIPLPPLAEQAAIVERVEALMGLCDRLEAAQRERDNMRRRYLAAGYAQWAEPADDVVSVDVSELLTRSVEAAQLKPLQQLILTLAIQGKLTADWRAAHPDVEPASQLLHRIQAERATLIAAKKLRPEKPLPKITAAEIPFEIPKGWEWCRFGDVVRAYEAGSSFKCEDREVTGQEWGVIKTSAVTSGSFNERENKFLRSDSPRDTSAKVQIGDLIFCRASGSKGLAGMCAIVRDCSLNLLLSDKTIRVPLMDGVSQEYIALHNDSAQSKAFFNGLSTGKSTSMNNVTRGELFKKPIPLPPLSEQTAIVARVESLLTTCRALEAEIEHSRTHAAHLLQAVLKEAFAPTDS